MKLLVPLLVMAGLLCVATGVLQVFLHKDDGCTEQFSCENSFALKNALAGMTFFSIAIILWGLAGMLTWMRKKFDSTP